MVRQPDLVCITVTMIDPLPKPPETTDPPDGDQIAGKLIVRLLVGCPLALIFLIAALSVPLAAIFWLLSLGGG